MNKKAVESFIVGISSVAVAGVDILAMSDSDYDSQAVTESRPMAVDGEQRRNRREHRIGAGHIRGEACDQEMGKENIARIDQTLKVLMKRRKISGAAFMPEK